MCLIAFALDASPRYRLLLAANRDEFHDRPAREAQWWSDVPGLYGGRDLNAGGTWLAIDRAGRLAAVTNFRERPHRGPGERSRGELCVSYLSAATSADAHAGALLPTTAQYGGFNLLLFDWASAGPHCVYLTNRAPHASVRTPGPGIHTLSNHLLNTRWPNSDRLGRTLAASLEDPDPFGALFQALADRTPVSHAESAVADSTDPEILNRTPFIFDPRYGTRASTVVAVGRDGTVRFAERSWRWTEASPKLIGERRLTLHGT